MLQRFLIFCLICLLSTPAAYGQPGQEGEQVPMPSTEEQLAGQFYNNAEWVKAAAAYEELYEKKPVNFYYTQLLNCYINLKDYKQAEKVVAKQAKRNARQPAYQVDLGWVYAQRGDDDDARKQYDKALKQLDVSDDMMIKDLANAFEGRGQLEYSVKTYLAARKVPQRIYRFNLELARLYDKRGETDKVVVEYLELINTQGYEYIDLIQQNLQDIIASDADGKKGELIKEQLLKEIQKNPSNIAFSDILIWFFIQKRDFESAFTQSKAIDKRLKENGNRIMELARLAMSNDFFDTGKKAYQYVIDKGQITEMYFYARKELAVAMYRKLTQAGNYTPEELTELHALLTNTYAELGPNENSAHVGIRKAHLEAFFMNRTDDAIKVLEELSTPQAGLTVRTANEVKLEMADIQLLTGEVWESTLLYSQVEKAMRGDTLGQEAKFRNSRLAYYKGEFDWAKAQLDVLKAATSKLISNDALELSLLIGDNLNFDSTGEALRMFSRADLAFFQNSISGALSTLDSLEAAFPESTLGDDLLFRRAKIFQRQGKTTEAIGQLEKLLAAYGKDILADNALFMLAGIYDYQIKDAPKAMELYKGLMTDFPGSLYVVEARKRFRTLRGDALQ
jgi:tetratricopeptide (TPR) repeat protein